LTQDRHAQTIASLCLAETRQYLSNINFSPRNNNKKKKIITRAWSSIKHESEAWAYVYIACTAYTVSSLTGKSQ